MKCAGRIRPRLRAVAFLITALVLAPIAARGEEFTLTQALALARSNDPEYLGTRARLRAMQERARQAFAYALPQISLKAGASRSDRRYETLNSPFPVPLSETEYDGYTAQVNLNQPLWRHQNLIGISQARLTVIQVEHELAAAEQDLLLRLAKAWLDAMSAADMQMHMEARRAAALRDWEQLQKAALIDLAATPELAEKQAKLDQAVAERIAALGELEIKRAALEEIVGPLPQFALPTLAASFTPPLPDDRMMNEWLELAEQNSPTVQAARAALEAADAEVRRQRAGHEPTVDLVGTYSLNNQGEGNFPGQSGYDIRQRSVGLEINVPLYQGGLQSARVREAVALRAQAEQELLSAIRSVRTASKTAWFAWQTSSARHAAAAQGLRSASLALRTASVGLAREINFDLAVLEAREELFEAWSKLQRARYDTVLEWMRLKAITGQLGDPDLLNLERHWMARDSAAQLLVAASR